MKNKLPKVFGIGFHKTGTSTLGKALEHLGYSVAGPQTSYAKHLLAGDKRPLFDLVPTYDAFQDNPWPILYRELDEMNPGSKFILTYRAESKLIKSVVNHFGKKHTDMRQWIYGVGHPIGNEQTYLDRYQGHCQEVRDYFKDRPGDLLEICWENRDSWEELCGFLGKKVPNVPIPHAKKREYSPLKKLYYKLKLSIRSKNLDE